MPWEIDFSISSAEKASQKELSPRKLKIGYAGTRRADRYLSNAGLVCLDVVPSAPILKFLPDRRAPWHVGITQK